jgi:hypothetical protein
MHKEELYDLYCSPAVIGLMNSRSICGSGHVGCMGENRNVYKVLVGKNGTMRLPGRYRHGGKYIIKVDLKEIGLEGLDWIDLAQNRDIRWAVVNVVMKSQVPSNAGNFLTN